MVVETEVEKYTVKKQEVHTIPMRGLGGSSN